MLEVVAMKRTNIFCCALVIVCRILTKMKPLYILPFDHRGSFITMFGFRKDALTPETRRILTDYKHVIYEGFLKALAQGVPKDTAAILVDEEFGARIQEEARAENVIRLLPVEKSGQELFDFAYGPSFGEHVNRFKPDYVKALVHYNPRGDAQTNRTQCERLKTLAAFCAANGYRFLFELLSPPTPDDLAKCGGDAQRYDREERFNVMREAIRELQECGIEPDVWKVEGLNDEQQMSAVVGEARRDKREKVGVVVLGRGEDEAKVRVWLSVATRVPGIIGFAVGRTVFRDPLLAFHQKQISRDAAATAIGEKYKSFADLFERAQHD